MSSNSSKHSRSGGDHGYGYGGSSGYGYGGASGYGYGYGGYGYGGYGYGYGTKREGGLQRSLQDYVLILRERIWYIIVIFLVVFSSALVYTLSQTKIYRASTAITISRRAPTVMKDGAGNLIQQDLIGPEEFGTIMGVFQSAAVLNKVAEHLTGAELKQFLEPYGPAGTIIGPGDILNENRSVTQRRGTFILDITYKHPVPAMAAKVANLFAEEYLLYKQRKKNDGVSNVVNDLELAVALQQKKIKELDTARFNFREENKMQALDKDDDLVRKKASDKTALVEQSQNNLDQAINASNQVDEYIRDKKDLKKLNFISSYGAITSLLAAEADLNIELQRLDATYGDQHPLVLEKQSQLAETEAQLSKAVERAVALVRTNVETARDTLATAKLAMKDALEQISRLNQLKLKYDEMTRQQNAEEAVFTDMNVKLVSYRNTPNLDPDPAAILDVATTPPVEAYVSPNMTVNLSLGVAAGLGLGLVFAFFVAYVDDRVKSSFDIESVVGLPLVAIIPQIKKMEQPDKAQIVANNADRQVSEAFLALHSALRLKDESKNGQCILITSTIPGEGKSFVTTNLALTFAAHGERVLIIDCDLRKPNIHKSFRQENLKGVIDVIAGGASFDEVTIKQLHPNLDVMTSGGRAKNPTQILNSKKFEIMVSDLRKRYDRIFFDTPPLAAVSDALIILPLMDGSLFSIFFNKVRRKAAQFAAKKLLEANVSVYGAVLNGLNLTVSGYYYAQYYDKSYKDYYVVMSKGESTPPAQE